MFEQLDDHVETCIYRIDLAKFTQKYILSEDNIIHPFITKTHFVIKQPQNDKVKKFLGLQKHVNILFDISFKKQTIKSFHYKLKAIYSLNNNKTRILNITGVSRLF